jgi:hypothetical protein
MAVAARTPRAEALNNGNSLSRAGEPIIRLKTRTHLRGIVGFSDMNCNTRGVELSYFRRMRNVDLRILRQISNKPAVTPAL